MSRPPILLSTAEAAALVQVRPATIRDWARRGLLAPAGGTVRRPLWDAWQVRDAADTPKPRRPA